MQTQDGEAALPVKSEVYKKREKMGKFAIFYHTNVKGKEPLAGTKLDAEFFFEEVKKLGFEPTLHDNMDCAPLLQQLETYAKDDHSNSTCFALAIFTHGDYDDVMYASDQSDDAKYNIWEVLKKFTATNCKSLEGRPKFFLFNTCRGDQESRGAPKTFMTPPLKERKTKVLTIPKEADFLIAHSACPDHKSWVGPEMGSYFITKFCEAIADENLHSLQDILTRVNGTTAEISAKEYDAYFLQMPTFSSQLTAELHLRDRSHKELPENWVYSMKQPKCGFFYIFSDERDDDVKQLELAASSLKFTAEHFPKKIYQEMQDIATAYIKGNYKDHDCFVCVIKSVSFEHDELRDGNKQKYNLKEFVQRFHGIECPALNWKPKIFIIQAPYIMVPGGNGGLNTQHTIPDTADTLIFYSTSPEPEPGTRGGTMFVHTLCGYLQELSTTGLDLLSVCSLVTQRMAGRVGLHVPTVTSQLRKRLIFK